MNLNNITITEETTVTLDLNAMLAQELEGKKVNRPFDLGNYTATVLTSEVQQAEKQGLFIQLSVQIDEDRTASLRVYKSFFNRFVQLLAEKDNTLYSQPMADVLTKQCIGKEIDVHYASYLATDGSSRKGFNLGSQREDDGAI